MMLIENFDLITIRINGKLMIDKVIYRPTGLKYIAWPRVEYDRLEYRRIREEIEWHVKNK